MSPKSIAVSALTSSTGVRNADDFRNAFYAQRKTMPSYQGGAPIGQVAIGAPAPRMRTAVSASCVCIAHCIRQVWTSPLSSSRSWRCAMQEASPRRSSSWPSASSSLKATL